VNFHSILTISVFRLGDLPLDDEIDIRDLPAIAVGVPTR
jgi:hypothetical protein